MDGIENAARWAGEAAVAIGKAVFDFLKDLAMLGAVVVADEIKYGLYLVESGLFAFYRAFRLVLVLNAYAAPFTDEIALELIPGLFNTSDLWRSQGNPPPGQYPIEEVAAETSAFTPLPWKRYFPFQPPASQNGAQVEQPAVEWVAPYRPGSDGGTWPDDFIEGDAGPQNMFRPHAPQQPQPGAPNTFSDNHLNFGAALANCLRAINLAEAGFSADAMLPNYNLDGDRGYAWPCWDVEHKPKSGGSSPYDPLSPFGTNPNPAVVNAVDA